MGVAYHSPIPCFRTRQVCHNGCAEANIALADSPDDSKQKEHAEALGHRPHSIRGHQPQLETNNPNIGTAQHLDWRSGFLQRHGDGTQQPFIEQMSLTVVRMSSGRLPCRSERAPVTGEARNCSSEKSEPIRPEESGGGSASVFASRGAIRQRNAAVSAQSYLRTARCCTSSPEESPRPPWKGLPHSAECRTRHPARRRYNTTPTQGKWAQKQPICCESGAHGSFSNHSKVGYYLNGRDSRDKASFVWHTLSTVSHSQHSHPPPFDLFEGEISMHFTLWKYTYGVLLVWIISIKRQKTLGKGLYVWVSADHTFLCFMKTDVNWVYNIYY